MLQKYKRLNNTGFTLIELLIVLGILGILAGFAAPSLLQINKPLKHAVLSIETQLGLMRVRAISTGLAHRLVMENYTFVGINDTFDPLYSRLLVESAVSCNSTLWKPVNDLALDLPDRVNVSIMLSLRKNSNSFCVDRRGLYIPGFSNGSTRINGVAIIQLKDFSGNSGINVANIGVYIGGRVGTASFRCIETYSCILVDKDSNGNTIY